MGNQQCQGSVLRHQWFLTQKPLNLIEKNLICFTGLCSRLLQRLKHKQRSCRPQPSSLHPVPAKIFHEIKLWGCVCVFENPRLTKMAWKEWGKSENCLGRKSGKLIIRNLLLISGRVSSHWNAKWFTQSDPSPPSNGSWAEGGVGAQDLSLARPTLPSRVCHSSEVPGLKNSKQPTLLFQQAETHCPLPFCLVKHLGVFSGKSRHGPNQPAALAWTVKPRH